MKTAVLVCTYNQPRELACVLEGLARQTTMDFEIYIADDGSGDETRLIIEKYRAQLPIPLQHVWQEDIGYRKARILNEAARVANADFLIFLDGDCIPFDTFVSQHITSAEQGRINCGERVMLYKEISTHLTPEMIRKGNFSHLRFSHMGDALRKKLRHLRRGMQIKNPLIRRLLKADRVKQLLGCNFSIMATDFFAVGGYDEHYEGYSKEDSDLQIRLLRIGIQPKSVSSLANVFHIHHPERSADPGNESRFRQLLNS